MLNFGSRRREKQIFISSIDWFNDEESSDGLQQEYI